jgi:glycosyltransferase involved in cell wall biosynthesis
MKDLSILIPARCEMLLVKTIQDILEHIEADTEIIAVLDGEWSEPAIPQHERVNVIYVPEAVGQRAATNLSAKLAKGKYVMKVDAHCSFDQGFDRKMIEAFKEDNVTMIPVMRNLHAYDWKCYSCGKKWYQANKPPECDVCHSTQIKIKMVWVGKERPQSTSYCFDSTPHFQYNNDYTRRPQYLKDKETGLTESMSVQGSCFMLTREKYFELDICDETLGNWGSQGIEVACKTWLSGGRVLINHNTWYAHLFRTNTVLHFPWPTSGEEQQKTRDKVKDLFWNHKWSKEIYPVSWLVKRFWPVKGWSEEDLNKL